MSRGWSQFPQVRLVLGDDEALGEGDWRPSLNWIDVFELLDDPPSS
jgi:hypothetical protein